MINLNKLILEAVDSKLIEKDDLIKSLLRIIGSSDLRDIIEANDWNNRLSVDLPVYKSKAMNVEELDSSIDDPKEDDDE